MAAAADEHPAGWGLRVVAPSLPDRDVGLPAAKGGVQCPSAGEVEDGGRSPRFASAEPPDCFSRG